jgi:predicted RNase H-like HicB family nuclease
MFNAIFEKHGDWWAGYIEEFPGVNTQGATLEEARANLTEAFQMVVETNREMSRRSKAADAVREPVAIPA